MLTLRHQVAPDVHADGGKCICGQRCGRGALVDELKSSSSQRLLLPDVLIPALRRQAQRVEHMRELRARKGLDWLEHGLVFPTASGPAHAAGAGPNAGWRRSARAHGLPPCRFHDLHHAWGSLMKSVGVSDEDLSQALGHASPQVTRSIYLHALPDSASRVAAAVNVALPAHPEDITDEQALERTLLALRVRRAAYEQRRES